MKYFLTSIILFTCLGSATAQMAFNHSSNPVIHVDSPSETRPGTASNPVMTAVRIPESQLISIDGFLNESVWQQAPVATEFTQRSPVRYYNQIDSDKLSFDPAKQACPSTWLEMSFTPLIVKNKNTMQYVGTVRDESAGYTFGSRYLFADIDQNTVALDTRINWTFTPIMSLQTYVRPFVSTGNNSEVVLKHQGIMPLEGISVNYSAQNQPMSFL